MIRRTINTLAFCMGLFGYKRACSSAVEGASRPPSDIGRKMKMQSVMMIACLAIGCGTSSVVPNGAPSPYDAQLVATVLEFDEQADKLVGAANFDAAHAELRAVGDAMAHSHTQRSRELRQLRDRMPPTKELLSIPCVSQKLTRPLSSDRFDSELVDALIQHRSCLVALAEDASKNARNPAVRHAAEELRKDTEAELAHLERWRSSWSQ
jgi:uncharacterized protein (DUF305 family)